MLQLRSLAFNVVFYASLVVQMFVWAPFYFLAPRLKSWRT
jgi:1-acyl-sn-glycerol-3-phosphate acyltransferase